jgi:hypothetical protein
MILNQSSILLQFRSKSDSGAAKKSATKKAAQDSKVLRLYIQTVSFDTSIIVTTLLVFTYYSNILPESCIFTMDLKRALPWDSLPR